MTFSRWDFQATKILLVLVIVGAPVLAVLLPAILTVSTDELQGYADDCGAGLTVTDPSTGLSLLSLLPGFAGATAVVVVAVLLLRLLTRIQRGVAFVEASVVALRRIAFTVLLAGLAVPLLGDLVGAEVVRRATGSDSLTFHVDALPVIGWAVAALLIAALAEAFAQGVRMARDVEGLV